MVAVVAAAAQLLEEAIRRTNRASQMSIHKVTVVLRCLTINK